MPPVFEQNASIILVGIRGAGKSTLASIASRALEWALVDERSFFEATTGFSMSAYIDRHGLGSYRRRQVDVLESLLREKKRCHVIECTSGCVQSAAGRSLLHEFCRSHPVIHVMRDLASVEKFLSDKWKGDISSVRREHEPIYDTCSNLTFYNLDNAISMPGSVFAESDPLQPRPLPRGYELLALKSVEHDFVRFLQGLRHSSGCFLDSHNINAGLGLESEATLPSAYMLPVTMDTISEHQSDLSALETCVDCFQFCVDFQVSPWTGTRALPPNDEISWRYALLRRMTTISVALCIRASAMELSNDASLEQAYFDLLSLGVKLGFDYLFVDMGVDKDKVHALVVAKGQTRVIGYHQDPLPSDDGWLAESRRGLCFLAYELGLDAVQVVQSPKRKMDNVAAISFADQMQRSTAGPFLVSAFNNGLLGRQSQCFNTFMTPVRSVAVEYLVQLWPPDILTPQDIEKALFASYALTPLEFYTVGTNVDYSVAPAVHNASFAAYAMPHVYRKLSTPSVTQLLDLADDPCFGGAGLSSPLKTAIMVALQSVGKDAQIIGAANTILPIRSWNNVNSFDVPDQRACGGQVLGLHGENTDWLGMKNCILRHLSPANAITPDTTALVMGAGGMSRAALYAIARCGVRSVFLWNRTYSHAVAIAEEFQRQVDAFRPLSPKFLALETLSEPWPRQYQQPTIIIDCIPDFSSESPESRPLSTLPGALSDEPLKVPDRWMRSPNGGVYLQLAYNTPLPSPVMCQVALKGYRGWVGVSGLEIFLEVAIAQFEYWCGRRAPRMVMRSALEKEFSANVQQRNVF